MVDHFFLMSCIERVAADIGVSSTWSMSLSGPDSSDRAWRLTTMPLNQHMDQTSA
jgi:hypothetical protein